MKKDEELEGLYVQYQHAMREHIELEMMKHLLVAEVISRRQKRWDYFKGSSREFSLGFLRLTRFRAFDRG